MTVGLSDCPLGLRRIMAEKIDSHHHLWRYDKETYRWIDENMGILRRDFLPPDLDKEIAQRRNRRRGRGTSAADIKRN